MPSSVKLSPGSPTRAASRPNATTCLLEKFVFFTARRAGRRRRGGGPPVPRRLRRGPRFRPYRDPPRRPPVRLWVSGHALRRVYAERAGISLVEAPQPDEIVRPGRPRDARRHRSRNRPRLRPTASWQRVQDYHLSGLSIRPTRHEVAEATPQTSWQSSSNASNTSGTWMQSIDSPSITIDAGVKRKPYSSGLEAPNNPMAGTR
jgi:hypothetical protein